MATAYYPAYRALAPATPDANRLGKWLSARVMLHCLLPELLPELLPAALETWLENEASGRPALHGPAAGTGTMAVSHSGEWAAVLLTTNGPCGVDIERIRDKAQRLAPRFLSEAEALEAARNPTAAHFTLLWSAKETLYKLAARRGLIFKTQLLLGPFVPSEGGSIPATLVLDGRRTRHLVCYRHPAPGYVLTYAFGDNE